MPAPTRVRLWYDPATFYPTRRVLLFGMDEQGPQVTEDFSFDADIPEETFKVPEGQSRPKTQ
jgi:outer membrane lipoprotein-sorting protein